MNEQMNILLEVLEEIKQQNRELKTSVSNLASQPISTTTSSEEDGISLTDVARLIGQKRDRCTAFCLFSARNVVYIRDY